MSILKAVVPVMAQPSLTDVQERLNADERLLQLQLQAQEDTVQHKGNNTNIQIDSGQISGSQLIASLVRSTAFTMQQQLPALHQPVNTPRWNLPQQADAAQAAVLAAVQQRWQALVLERLQAAQMFLPDVHLAGLPRTAQELEQLRNQVADPTEAWERIGGSHSPFTGSFQAPSVSKLLYDAEDVLHAVTAAVSVPQPRSQAAPQRPQSPQQQQQQQQPPLQLCLLQVVRAPTRIWLQSFFADLKPDKRQVGVDDLLHSWFRKQQVQQAYRAASSCSAAACRAAARTGLPPSERPWVWATALGIHAMPLEINRSKQDRSAQGAAASTAAGGKAGALPGTSSSSLLQQGSAAVGAGVQGCGNWWQLPSQRDKQLLELLCGSVEQQVLLTDVLTCADVQCMADNEHYFVFEEAMRAVLLAFSRDASASISAVVQAAPRLASEEKGGKQLKPYPPSGILPFQGLASYVAPLCYLYEHPAAMYKVFVAMYGRYWSCLHALNARPAPAAGLPVLCRTFLELLQEIDPDVYLHLSRLSGSPLDLAFPWMMSAFVTYLPPSETLLLWDRIIGFDSLLPLPVLAAAVMAFRRDLVLAVQSSDELLEVLEDLSQLRVVPLMQALLFDS